SARRTSPPACIREIVGRPRGTARASACTPRATVGLRRLPTGPARRLKGGAPELTRAPLRLYVLPQEKAMTQRLSYKDVAPEAHRALLGLESHVRKSGIDQRLLDLVYLRVSQINGCAYCIDMHSKDLHAAGETAQRIDLLSVFREAPVYSDR